MGKACLGLGYGAVGSHCAPPGSRRPGSHVCCLFHSAAASRPPAHAAMADTSQPVVVLRGIAAADAPARPQQMPPHPMVAVAEALAKGIADWAKLLDSTPPEKPWDERTVTALCCSITAWLRCYNLDSPSGTSTTLGELRRRVCQALVEARQILASSSPESPRAGEELIRAHTALRGCIERARSNATQYAIDMHLFHTRPHPSAPSSVRT